MSERLYRAIYVSRTRPGGGPGAEVADGVLDAAQLKNRRLGVTGLLLVHDDWFVQALEGPRPAVSDLLMTIGADPRHADMEVAVFQPIEQRLFPDWSMALARYTNEMDGLLEAVRDDHGLDPRRLEPVVLLMLLSEARRLLPQAA